MKAHRHAWVDCTHDDTGPCGLLKCIYCTRKRRQYQLTSDDIDTLAAFDENGNPIEETK